MLNAIYVLRIIPKHLSVLLVEKYYEDRGIDRIDSQYVGIENVLIRADNLELFSLLMLVTSLLAWNRL